MTKTLAKILVTASMMLASAASAQFIGEGVWKSVSSGGAPPVKGSCLIMPGFINPCSDSPPSIGGLPGGL